MLSWRIFIFLLFSITEHTHTLQVHVLCCVTVCVWVFPSRQPPHTPPLICLLLLGRWILPSSPLWPSLPSPPCASPRLLSSPLVSVCLLHESHELHHADAEIIHLPAEEQDKSQLFWGIPASRCWQTVPEKKNSCDFVNSYQADVHKCCQHFSNEINKIL